MNRRSFFTKMIGGVAATAAVRAWPFRVFSFPSEIAIAPPATVRFIRAFDPLQNRVISRFDVLYGFGVLNANSAFPQQFERRSEFQQLQWLDDSSMKLKLPTKNAFAFARETVADLERQYPDDGPIAFKVQLA